MIGSLPVVNLAEAKFECTYGRGCEGLCCRRSKPPVTEEEIARIERILPQVMPHLRESARKKIEKEGFHCDWMKNNDRTLRVVDNWCVFFNQGCVLHKIGLQEGDSFRYKPLICSVFPLDRNRNDQWYVRQWGYEKEGWDLFCLNPQASAQPAVESLRVELRLIEQLHEQGVCETVEESRDEFTPLPSQLEPDCVVS